MARLLRQPRFIAAGAFFLLFLLVVGAQPAAAATTWIVDDDGIQCPFPHFNSINAAIGAAGPGDTIDVCPGTYNEMVNVNEDDLTLLGAQANVDARTRPFLPDPLTQSIIQHPCGPVQFTADNLELNGFTIQGSTLSDPCFLSGIWSNPDSSGTDGGFEILNNIVQDNISGIELNSKCTATATLVQFNLIQNNSVPGPGSGNGIQTNTAGLCNATIDRNKFSGHTSSSFLVVVPSSNLNVTNNELVAGSSERILLATVSTGTISGNVSMGSTGVNGTIRLFGGDSNITINSNTLFNGVRAIRVSDLGAGPNTGVVAHFNCIDGNSVAGMQVDSGGHSGTLNAENNWWGSPNGPTHPSNPAGTGDVIIDPDDVVDFIPFLNQCPTAPAGEAQKDLVVGTGTIMGFGDPVVHVNASRNPNTSEVKGRFYIRYPDNAFEVAGKVTCLTVNLNKAGVGGVIERVKGTPPPIFGPTMPGNNVLITVLDMGEPGTLDEVNEGQLAGASTNCPSTGNTFPIERGNYVVKAEPPPALLSSLSTLIAEFEAAANCSASIVCSGTGEFIEP
jgi:nitrous oxidase accessory protein NosD